MNLFVPWFWGKEKITLDARLVGGQTFHADAVDGDRRVIAVVMAVGYWRSTLMSAATASDGRRRRSKEALESLSELGRRVGEVNSALSLGCIIRLVPYLATHAAVDGKIDWVREWNEEIGEEDEDVDDVVVEHSQVERSVEDVQDGEDGQRNLDDEETRNDDDEHQRRAVGIPQFPAFARLPVLLEELVAFLLGAAQSAEQQDVEHDQRGARPQVDADDAEPKVQIVVDHLTEEWRVLSNKLGGKPIFRIGYLTENVVHPIGFVFAARRHFFTVPADFHRQVDLRWKKPKRLTFSFLFLLRYRPLENNGGTTWNHVRLLLVTVYWMENQFLLFSDT